MILSIPSTIDEIYSIIDSSHHTLALYGLAVVQCSRVEFLLEDWASFFYKDDSLQLKLKGQSFGTKLIIIKNKNLKSPVLELCNELNKSRIYLDHGVLGRTFESKFNKIAVDTGLNVLLKSSKSSFINDEINFDEKYLESVILNASKIIKLMLKDFQGKIQVKK